MFTVEKHLKEISKPKKWFQMSIFLYLLLKNCKQKPSKLHEEIHNFDILFNTTTIQCILINNAMLIK